MAVKIDTLETVCRRIWPSQWGFKPKSPSFWERWGEGAYQIIESLDSGGELRAATQCVK
jgi:hypothetical protein